MTTSTPSARVIARAMCKGSECESSGFRVSVFPSFVPDHSDPGARQFVFGYRVRITNESTITAQLLARAWKIVDANGRENEVRGEGVVGQQPVIRPGQTFEYASFCHLTSPWGTMEGEYVFQREGDEHHFGVKIARFFLVSNTGDE
ncbi:MAG: Co2+/Mg2+ efflux protein ApaG [Phycisphaerales bacterium]|nr:Co2+/Mg2+ efflux protein ApaG [Phycisphaerales bacterium]